MTPFAIAGIQMHVAALRENIIAMRHQIDLLMNRFPWVQMVVFSELAPYGPLPELAKPLPNGAEEAFQEMAKRHGVWLLPGSMFEQSGEVIYNTASVIDPQGKVVGRYRKMFPFLPFEAGIASGEEPLVFDVPGIGRFGVSICYDIWFPETTRMLTSMGVEVLLHPVLTGTIDRDVELSIARATSAMFQCYVFDINGIGAGGVGRSAVFDPLGSCLYQAAGAEEMIPIEVDFDLVRRQRAVGIKGLGQTLKSFRDRAVDFTNYDRTRPASPYLAQLGPLEMPARGSRAGLDGSLVPELSDPGGQALPARAAAAATGKLADRRGQGGGRQLTSVKNKN